MDAEKPSHAKRGRPEHKPTAQERQIVEILAGYGIPQDKIALAIGITFPTLEKHYREELDGGAAKVQRLLVGNLVRLASGNDGTALKAVMFSLQTRFGWSQYAPEHVEKTRPLGKKEEADIAARTAHQESDWGHLVH